MPDGCSHRLRLQCHLRNFARRINSPFAADMKRLWLVVLFSIFALASQGAAPPTSGEYIILVGGPSMYQWEKYKAVPHDHWWANFVRAARLRTEQLRAELGPDEIGRASCRERG